jgi:hypothetical protein
MSTTAQILANQHNAAFSTGPSTPNGKAASSQNAVKHGLSGGFVVLPHEDRPEFDRLLGSYRQTFSPNNDHEAFLVERMVESRWKMSRLTRMEAALIQQMTSQDTNRTDPDAVIVAAMLAGNANAYASLQRYSAAAERSYYKAKHELERERARTAKLAAVRPVQNEPKSVPSKSTPKSTNVFDYLRNPNATLDDVRKLVCSDQPTKDRIFT